MSKKAVKENNKTKERKGAKIDVPFKQLTPAELVEFNTRRANGEDESAIAADFKRRRRA